MGVNTKYTFDQEIFLKSLADDINEIVNMSGTYPIARRIRSLVVVDKGLREAATTIKFGLASASNNLIDCIEKYKKIFNSEGKSIIEDYKNMMNTLSDFGKECGREWYGNNDPIMGIIRNIKNILHTCDNINEFTQIAYRVDSLPETKFSRATASSIVEFEAKYGYKIPVDNSEFEEVMKLSSENFKINSPEYGKVICKRVRALKSEIVSITNKYFGKNSKLGEFNILDKVL